MDTDRPHWGLCDRATNDPGKARGADAISASRNESDVGNTWIAWLFFLSRRISLGSQPLASTRGLLRIGLDTSKCNVSRKGSAISPSISRALVRRFFDLIFNFFNSVRVGGIEVRRIGEEKRCREHMRDEDT